MMDNTTTSTFDPWNVAAPFTPMFRESVTLKHKATSDNESGKACVFPLETVDPFEEQSVENEAKMISVLLLKDGIVNAPKVGDELVLSDETSWSVSNVELEQTWWKMTARGGLAQ